MRGHGQQSDVWLRDLHAPHRCSQQHRSPSPRDPHAHQPTQEGVTGRGDRKGHVHTVERDVARTRRDALPRAATAELEDVTPGASRQRPRA